MARFFKYTIALLNLPRLIFHLLFYFVYINKCRDDVSVAIRHRWPHVNGSNFALGFIFLLVWDKTYRNIFYFRIGFWKYLIQWLAPPHNSFKIYTYADIEPGLLGVHSFATYIYATKVGRNFTIRNNVTIGKGTKGMPIIGNNVTIYVNCVIFGDIVIGDNVIIGAGSIVNKSIPSNCVVVGNPARIVKRNGIRVNEAL